QDVLTSPRVVFKNNNVIGESPDCLVDADGVCVTDLDELNECDWDFCLEASGNIGEDPEFADDAYRLAPGSALIDAGLNPLTLAPIEAQPFCRMDFEGDMRPGGEDWDIGADEYVP
ncbi:hypothetical protein KDL45_18820, partial [bacterium]|nr:hypothetical protein [bacterium]